MKNKDAKYLRPIFQSSLSYNWFFGLVLILLFGIPRFILVLSANVTKNYGTVSVIFILMWIVPFLFLNKEGRRFIGIKEPKNYLWLVYSLILGGLICAATYASFTCLFGHTISNAFVYISNSYATTGMELTTETRMTYFLIFSLTGMTFSPIGEELFYRGLVHGSFVSRFGEQKASLIDSLAFAITHLAHFGIIYFSDKWGFLFLPSLLWVISMFFASRIFFLSKQKTGSIVGAILSHAGYNVAMMYFIFYHIL